MNEEEIMNVLDEFMEHYEKLEDKANKDNDPNRADYAMSMWTACKVLKRRFRTAFKNHNKS